MEAISVTFTPTSDADNAHIWNVRDYEHRWEGIAILDNEGTICYLNQSWQHILGFHPVYAGAFCVGANYLTAIETVCDPEHTCLQLLGRALQMLLHGEKDYAELEYLSTSHDSPRWFRVQMSVCTVQNARGVLIQQSELSLWLDSVDQSVSYAC
jgi:PAS domain-containing protein